VRDTALIDDLVKRSPAEDAFYTPPDPLPGDTCGDPVYLRPLENTFSVPDGGENWLVLYRSETAGTNPAPVATSGIIVLPDRSKRPVPDGGYPLISWCHGTVGVANRVAPSRNRGDTGASPMNAYPTTLLSRFLDQGWAVAMTDYEALGTGTADKLHPYMLGQSEARAALTSSWPLEPCSGTRSPTGSPSWDTPRAARPRCSPPPTPRAEWTD
jgi:hypothetical protein